MSGAISIDGYPCVRAELHVPELGPWWADVDFEVAPDVTGRVTLRIGALELQGTIHGGGDYAAQRRVRVVAGGGGWGTLVGPQHYHNDAGVRALTVAQDAARLAGEELGDFAPESTSVGVAYVRQAGAASRVLEDVVGAIGWWVGYDGRTVVGARETSDAPVGAYEVLEYDPREELALIAVDDLTQVGIGSRLTDGLGEPRVVRELEVIIDAETARVRAWCGAGGGRLARAFRRLVDRMTSGQLFGKYRYRAVEMSADRVKLQAVVSRPGLPDLIPVSMRPGTAGAHAELTPGTVVLVEFIEGDRRLPIVTAFAGRDEGAHAPAELDFSVTATLRLGGPGASQGVPMGDSLKTYLDNHTHLAGTLASPSGAVTGSTGAPAAASPFPSEKVFVE